MVNGPIAEVSATISVSPRGGSRVSLKVWRRLAKNTQRVCREEPKDKIKDAPPQMQRNVENGKAIRDANLQACVPSSHNG